MPMQVESDPVEKERNCQMEVKDQCLTTFVIIDLYKERHASERIVMDQTINQVRRECKR